MNNIQKPVDRLLKTIEHDQIIIKIFYNSAFGDIVINQYFKNKDYDIRLHSIILKVEDLKSALESI